MSVAPAILNIHTPTSSFSIVHSLTQDTLQSLYDTLSRKPHTNYRRARVGPGWLKYEFNDSIWNLDDEQDYTIFVWRQLQLLPSSVPSGRSDGSFHTQPTLHLHNPAEPLPIPPTYQNTSYYLFQPSRAPHSLHTDDDPPTPSMRSKKSQKTRKQSSHPNNDVPAYKKEFEKFHEKNGVRTVIGSIGPVQDVRMLLKDGYRYVYMSRKFAVKHGFVPKDAAPGYHGYNGLVNIGTWPITLISSPLGNPQPNFSPQPADTEVDNGKQHVPKPTMIGVYLSEEPHFDIVLGRSFFEKRKIRTSSTDPTDVVCLDTGEKIECELVILKDGRGEIVTVT